MNRFNNNLYDLNLLLSNTNHILDNLHRFNYILLQTETSNLLKEYILFLSKFTEFKSIIIILDITNELILNISEEIFESNKNEIVNYIDEILDNLEICITNIFILKDMSNIKDINNLIIINCFKLKKYINQK